MPTSNIRQGQMLRSLIWINAGTMKSQCAKMISDPQEFDDEGPPRRNVFSTAIAI